jgi:hypothetical protein
MRQFLYTLIIALIYSCSGNLKKSELQDEDFKKLTIDDPALKKIFMTSSPCKKLAIMQFYKADLLPAGEGFSNDFIVEIEALTKHESSRTQTQFGSHYESEEDLKHDFAYWSKILNCE